MLKVSLLPIFQFVCVPLVCEGNLQSENFFCVTFAVHLTVNDVLNL